MTLDRKALAVTLGLFLHTTLPLVCAAQTTLSGRAASLWVEGDAFARGWGQSFTYQPGRGPSFSINLGGLVSNLAWADFEAAAMGFNAGFSGERLGLDLSGGFWSHSRLAASAGGYSLRSDGGAGYYAGAAASLDTGAFTLGTSFFYSQAQWRDGDLYLFLGKPLVPALYGLGLALAREPHRLDLTGLNLDLAVQSNEGEAIFQGGLRVFTAAYTFAPGGPQARFSATLGWTSALGQAGGALDLSNQHSFPVLFRIFEPSGDLSAHGVYAHIRAALSPGVFQFRLDAGAVQGLGGEIRGRLHYRMSKLLGGEEQNLEMAPLTLEGKGAAFFLLDAALRLGRDGRFTLGLQKALLFPWDYKQPPAPPGEEPAAPKLPPDFLRSLLLSGLSLYARLAL
jgi:hypothetical protein